MSSKIGSALDSTGGFWNGFVSSGRLQRENVRLRQELSLKSNYQETISLLEARLDEMRKLQGIAEQIPRGKVGAEIIGFDPAANRVTINVGSSKGILPGQAVICGEGLVGVIQSTESGRSQALLVTSPALRIGAMVNAGSPLVGILRGQSRGVLALEILDASAKIQIGAQVVSSMHSEKLPAYIPIGRVIRQENAEQYGLTKVYVAPNADISRVREVIVLK